MKNKIIPFILIGLVVILILTFFSKENTKEKYNQVFGENVKQKEKIQELERNIMNNYIFTLGIPDTIILSPESGIKGSPYKIDTKSEYLMINGVIELLCKVYHITNKTVLEHYQTEIDIEQRILNKPYIKLKYNGTNKKVPFSLEQEKDVDELILWYDTKGDSVMISILADDKYSTHSLKGAYYTKKDVIDSIYAFISTHNRAIQ